MLYVLPYTTQIYKKLHNKLVAQQKIASYRGYLAHMTPLRTHFVRPYTEGAERKHPLFLCG